MTLRGIFNALTSSAPPAPKGSTAPTPNVRWAGRGAEVKVGFFHLLEPLVYVHDSRRGPCDEPAAIDLAQPIANVSVPPTGRELPYWPSYQTLQPHQRRFYLQWLAGSRTSVPPEFGYTFLFFYNLERRALIDRADIRSIASEVLRLRSLYGRFGTGISGSWEGYSSRFLWMLMLVHKDVLTVVDVRMLAKATTHWTEETIATALGCLMIRNCPLNASLAYSVAAFLPQSLRSIVQRRVPGEFEALFKERFREQFPEGMEFRPSTAKRTLLYRPANNVLSPAELSFPNPLGVMSQFKPLSKIWNACIEDLKKLGSLSRLGAEIDAVKRWEALPDTLRAGTDHPLTEEFCKLVESRGNEAGQTIIQVEELAAVIDPEGPAKLTATRSRRLCQTAEQIGYFLEPDARLTGRAYRAEEQVIAFLKMSTAPIDPARYGPAACMLQFGFLVATSDGQADERELEVITRHIESAFELQEDEVRRMERLRLLLQKTGPDRALLRRLVKNLKKPQRQAIAKLLVAIVMADGVVTKAERKSLKAACVLLNIDYSTIELLLPKEADSDEPVTVIPAKGGLPGERVPSPPEKAFTLDRSAIAAILAETRDVAKMLAQAMASADDAEQDDESEAEALPEAREPAAVVEAVVSPTPVVASVSGPPAKYQELYAALIAQDRWPIPEAQQIARKHGQMLSGALDVLNEWATEAYGGQLFFEELDNLVIDRSLLT